GKAGAHHDHVHLAAVRRVDELRIKLALLPLFFERASRRLGVRDRFALAVEAVNKFRHVTVSNHEIRPNRMAVGGAMKPMKITAAIRIAMPFNTGSRYRL